MPSKDREKLRATWARKIEAASAETARINARIETIRAEMLATCRVVYDRERGIGEVPSNLVARCGGNYALRQH